MSEKAPDHVHAPSCPAPMGGECNCEPTAVPVKDEQPVASFVMGGPKWESSITGADIDDNMIAALEQGGTREPDDDKRVIGTYGSSYATSVQLAPLEPDTRSRALERNVSMLIFLLGLVVVAAGMAQPALLPPPGLLVVGALIVGALLMSSLIERWTGG